MTVLALWHEKTKRGLELAVLSDQRVLRTNLRTRERTIDHDGMLKSIALSDTCCVACAGDVNLSDGLFCHLARHEDWLEELAESPFDVARRIEGLPSRIGLTLDDTIDAISNGLPALLDRIPAYGEEGDTFLRETAVYAAGRLGGQALVVQWLHDGLFQEARMHYPEYDTVSLRWPTDYMDEDSSAFVEKLNPLKALPIAIRARSAMKYASSLGIIASPEYSLRLLSERFALREGGG